MDNDDPSKLPYVEVGYQLQILEHIAQKGPLSPGDLALQRQLEARDRELVEAKLTQAFDAAPRSKDGADNSEAWKRAAEYTEFRSKAENIARRQLNDEADLSEKYQQDLKKLGHSTELDAVFAGQQKLQARHYDEDRGRYARQFLKSCERARELDQGDKQRSPGKDLEP